MCYFIYVLIFILLCNFIVNLKSFILSLENQNKNSDDSRNKQQPGNSPDITSDRWVASLRRRDPEIQPTLPAINRTTR